MLSAHRTHVGATPCGCPGQLSINSISITRNPACSEAVICPNLPQASESILPGQGVEVFDKDATPCHFRDAASRPTFVWAMPYCQTGSFQRVSLAIPESTRDVAARRSPPLRRTSRASWLPWGSSRGLPRASHRQRARCDRGAL